MVHVEENAITLKTENRMDSLIAFDNGTIETFEFIHSEEDTKALYEKMKEYYESA